MLFAEYAVSSAVTLTQRLPMETRLAFLLALHLAVMAHAQETDLVRLDTYVGPHGYLHPEYAEPVIGADYLFYPKERVRFEVSIVNRGRVPVLFQLSSDPASLVALRAVRGTEDSPITSDSLRIDSPMRVTLPGGPESEVVAGSNVVLHPDGTLVLSVELTGTANWPDGAVQIRATVSLQCRPACVVRPFASVFRIELRTVLGTVDRMEREYRAALTSMFAGNYDAAELALQRVDAEVPGTPTALYLHGIIAERAGHRVQALQFYERAEAAILSRRDFPDMKLKGTGLDEFQAAVKAAIRRLQASRDDPRVKRRAAKALKGIPGWGRASAERRIVEDETDDSPDE